MRLKRRYICIMLIALFVPAVVSCSETNKRSETILPIEGIVSAGRSHVVAIKQDGTVVATGRNSYGQCDVDNWNNIVQVSAGTDYTLGLKKDGTVVATGENSYEKLEVSDWKDVIYISAGRYPVGITNSGKVITTSNYIKENYDIENIDNVKYVSMDLTGSIFIINEQGEIISLFEEFKTNERTQKFISNLNKPVSVKSTGLLSAGLFDTGDLLVKDVASTFSVGKRKYENIVQYDLDYDLVGMLDKYGKVKIMDCIAQNVFINKYADEWKEWEDIISICVGLDFAIGLKSDGTLVAAGDNEYGQCDVSDWTNIATEPMPMDIETN